MQEPYFAPLGNDPFAIVFTVDDGSISVVNRTRGVGDRGLPNMTFMLSDGETILVSLIPHALPPFAPTGQIRIDAGSREIGECKLDAVPFRFHVHKPGMGRAPAPGKNHTLPGSMKKPG